MSIVSVIGNLATEYAAARSRYLTERQVHSLPLEIQKDIGWPDICRRKQTLGHLGAWAGPR